MENEDELRMDEEDEANHGRAFELEEEEYGDEEEHDETVQRQNTVANLTWWAGVTEVCHDVNAEDEESDGVQSDSDLESIHSDDDVPRKREYNPRSNRESFKFKLGMHFSSIEELRRVLKEEFIMSDRDYKYVSNDQRRVRIKCKGKGCKWLLYARVLNSDKKTVRINTLIDQHECGIVFDNRLVTSTWLAHHFIDQFRLNPNLDYQSFKELSCAAKFTNCTKNMFYRAKKKARASLEGSVEDQYAILEDYCKQLISTSPGTTALLKTRMVNEKGEFERVYICLAACKEGFNRACRPLLGFDGCFLKGYCKGMLLAALGIDPNNSQFPVAYAVVEKENTETWTWFMSLLKEDLEIDNPRTFTIISDRQKRLEKAVSDVFPGAEVRFCVRHLHANFKKEHSGMQLKQFLWACAKASLLSLHNFVFITHKLAIHHSSLHIH